jgi:hypothetical protein
LSEEFDSYALECLAREDEQLIEAPETHGHDIEGDATEDPSHPDDISTWQCTS